MNGGLHHVELWVPDLERSVVSWGWLLESLGWSVFQEWPVGRSWRLAETYLVVEQSPDLSAGSHDRCRPGLNHLAFHVDDPRRVDELAEAAGAYGWRPLFAQRYPYAGGRGRHAAYLEDGDGYEVELVAPHP